MELLHVLGAPLSQLWIFRIPNQQSKTAKLICLRTPAPNLSSLVLEALGLALHRDSLPAGVDIKAIISHES